MDIIAGLCELFGLILIGFYFKTGFIFNIIGCILWIFVVYNGGPHGLLFVVIPGIFINIVNYKRWSKNKNNAIH